MFNFFTLQKLYIASFNNLQVIYFYNKYLTLQIHIN